MSDARERRQRVAAAATGTVIGLTTGSGPLGVVAGAALGPLLAPFARLRAQCM